MEKFEHKFRGYNINQVNNFIDEMIREYESLLEKSKKSEAKFIESEIEIKGLKDKLKHYEQVEETLNRAIFTAESKSSEIKRLAHEESERIINDARRNANRIINEALIKAEKAEEDTDRLKRNINYLKRKLRSIVEGQLEVIDELEKIDFRSNDRDGIY